MTRKDTLAAGLAKMAANFVAHLCPVCKGEGEYTQTYTVGCGMGVYRALGDCDYCDGTGLMVGNDSASASVVNQVLVAAGKGSDQ